MSFLISGLTHHFDRQSASCATDLTRHVVVIYPSSSLSFDRQAQLQDLYGVEVSAGLISNVTDAVEDERKLWQNRPLERVGNGLDKWIRSDVQAKLIAVDE